MIKKFISFILILIFINIGMCKTSYGNEVILENGTRIRLKLVDKISTGLNREGDEVNFVVTDDIKLGDFVLIREGARATGIISELISRGRVGKAGKMTINFDYVKAVNGKKVPLNGIINKKGEDKMVLSVALSFVLTPICLLLRGTEATLPAGYQVQVRTDRDTKLVMDDNFVPVNSKKYF